MVQNLSIILLLLVICFIRTHGALSCYACTNCGTTWDASKVTIVQTSGSNDYCRKTAILTDVTKDYGSTCLPINILGNGGFCCQTDLCNSSNKQFMKMINVEILLVLIWIIYYYQFY